jgi:hypothetical protein
MRVLRYGHHQRADLEEAYFNGNNRGDSKISTVFSFAFATVDENK